MSDEQDGWVARKLDLDRVDDSDIVEELLYMDESEAFGIGAPVWLLSFNGKPIAVVSENGTPPNCAEDMAQWLTRGMVAPQSLDYMSSELLTGHATLVTPLPLDINLSMLKAAIQGGDPETAMGMLARIKELHIDTIPSMPRKAIQTRRKRS